MGFRQGVQAEVLTSLALVMITGTGLLAAVLLEINQVRVEALHGLLGRGFVSAIASHSFALSPLEAGHWWRLDARGRVSGVNASAELLDVGTRELAEEALGGGQPLVQSGAPWAPIRFAAPGLEANEVFAGRIDAPLSGGVLAVMLVVDVLIFGLFGVTLLRRRVVGPLHRLASAVREVGEGDLPARVPVEGVGEIEELGAAFNEMQEALASRTGALEKAVQELRVANDSLVQAREGLDRAERLAMVGSLAAGVAHEVGNPMGALLAFLDVAARDSGITDEGRYSLDKASQQGERVRVILRQLLDFSRPPQVERGPICLEEVAQQVVELVAAQKDFCDIEFEVRVEPGIGRALGDAGLASQILLNLALNAAAAMRDAPIRRLVIEIESAARQRRSSDEADRLGARGRVDSIACLVGDSGPGIMLDEPQRIFDPFFTTKAPGEGTGLGLANARRLAQEMGGRLELDLSGSEDGGALFRFTLPREDRLVTPARAGSIRGDDASQSRMP
ncbi:MAG: hypothetical protein CL908_02885 [Deltaproteobacteria bacterium]|nr:hypothetical protein [Deltaproteobacteria bacterium]